LYPVDSKFDAVHIPDGMHFQKEHFCISQSYKVSNYDVLYNQWFCQDYIENIMIPEGMLKDRVEKLA
jgi:hypothetical protein